MLDLFDNLFIYDMYSNSHGQVADDDEVVVHLESVVVSTRGNSIIEDSTSDVTSATNDELFRLRNELSILQKNWIVQITNRQEMSVNTKR